MKTANLLCCLIVISLAALVNGRAEVIIGPVTNPANGHDYYLLAPGGWTAAEA